MVSVIIEKGRIEAKEKRTKRERQNNRRLGEFGTVLKPSERDE